MYNLVILGAAGFVGKSLIQFYYKKKIFKLFLYDVVGIEKKYRKKFFFRKIDIRQLSNSQLPKENFFVINVCAELGNKDYDKHKIHKCRLNLIYNIKISNA